MTTPRNNAHLFKAIADGYLVERHANHGGWVAATLLDLQENPNGSFRIPIVSIETRKYSSYTSWGSPFIGVVTRAENEADPRDKWSRFYGWADSWEAHNVPAYKGPRHEHADMIHAWADGAQLRWRMPGEKTWRYEASGGTPRFSEGYIYEVAPKLVRSRRAMVKPGWNGPPVVAIVMEGACMTPEEFQTARGDTFIGWIDSTWQEHEVPGGAA